MSHQVATRFLAVAIFFIVVIAGMLQSMLPDESESPDASSDIVGYYQTAGGHRVASYIALTLFRRVYRGSRLYVHYDVATPAHPVAADLITYSNQSERSAKSTGMHFSTATSALAYIHRLQRAATMGQWVLLLEDDVWVYRRIDTRELSYDISGTCWATYRAAYAAILNHSCYGGYGGHLLKSSRLLALNGSSMSHLIDTLLAAHKPIASDELISAIIIQDGGNIGEYDGYREISGITLAGKGLAKTFHRAKMLYFLG